MASLGYSMDAAHGESGMFAAYDAVQPEADWSCGSAVGSALLGSDPYPEPEFTRGVVLAVASEEVYAFAGFGDPYREAEPTRSIDSKLFESFSQSADDFCGFHSKFEEVPTLKRGLQQSTEDTECKVLSCIGDLDLDFDAPEPPPRPNLSSGWPEPEVLPTPASFLERDRPPRLCNVPFELLACTRVEALANVSAATLGNAAEQCLRGCFKVAPRVDREAFSLTTEIRSGEVTCRLVVRIFEMPPMSPSQLVLEVQRLGGDAVLFVASFRRLQAFLEARCLARVPAVL